MIPHLGVLIIRQGTNSSGFQINENQAHYVKNPPSAYKQKTYIVFINDLLRIAAQNLSQLLQQLKIFTTLLTTKKKTFTQICNGKYNLL